jgi:hypothetical protein
MSKDGLILLVGVWVVYYLYQRSRTPPPPQATPNTGGGSGLFVGPIDQPYAPTYTYPVQPPNPSGAPSNYPDTVTVEGVQYPANQYY